MMIDNKILYPGSKIYFLMFFTIVLFINYIFLYFYYQGLGLKFTYLSFVFLFIFVACFTLLFYVFKNIILRLIMFLLYALTLIYLLINYAYFDVFNIFWKLSLAQFREMNSSMISLLSEYYVLVPRLIYVLALALFIVTVVISICYASRFNNKSRGVRLEEYNKRPYAYIFFFLIGINLLSFNTIELYKRNSLENFSRQKYYMDLGVHGFAFDNIYKLLESSFANGNGDTVKPSENNLKTIRDSLKEMDFLKNSEARIAVEYKNNLKKPHVIIYQLESVGAWALDQEPSPMPVLEKLIDDNISVDGFFSNGCTTINTEFSSVCSFYPEKSGPVSDLFAYNDYYCLPQILKDDYGYTTSQYHSNFASFWNRDKLGERWGYENNYFVPKYNVRDSDDKLLADVVRNIKDSQQPTFNYVIGFTSHSPHTQQFMDMNFYENDLNISAYQDELNNSSLKVDMDEETIRNYYGFLTAVDDAIAGLFDNLKKEGLIDNTVVIILGDHRYYNFRTDDDVDDFYNYNKIPFMVYVPGGYQGNTRSIASNVDIAPTILHLIEGASYKNKKSFLGESIFLSKHSESVLNKCSGESYFLTNDILLKNFAELDATRPISFFHKYAKIKYDDYERLFNNIIYQTDNILLNNQLGENADYLATSSEAVVLKIDFDQATDFDKDGLSDMRERALGTDLENPDSDGDGYLDGVEIANNYNPLGEGRF